MPVYVRVCLRVYMCELTQGHGLGVRSLCFASSGGEGSHQLVVSGGDDMVVKVWDQRMKSAVASMSGHK
jgi:WD40 repeat protein